jgi:hypothetical protein
MCNLIRMCAYVNKYYLTGSIHLLLFPSGQLDCDNDLNMFVAMTST